LAPRLAYRWFHRNGTGRNSFFVSRFRIVGDQCDFDSSCDIARAIWPDRNPIHFGHRLARKRERRASGFHFGVEIAFVDESSRETEGLFVKGDSGQDVSDIDDGVSEFHGASVYHAPSEIANYAHYMPLRA